MLLGITAWGLSRGVPIYERFVEGAKEGWQTALRVLPYLVGMLVAIQVFQHSGALDQLIRVLTPFTSRLGFPPEALPMALIRPISGSGSWRSSPKSLQPTAPILSSGAWRPP